MLKDQYLALTNPEDQHIGHIPFVAEHMDGKLQVIDPVPATIAGKGLSYFISNSSDFCEYGGVRLDRVASVWDRRPTHVTREMFERVDLGYRRYSYSAVQQLARQIFVQFPDALWVSDRFAVQRAELKSVQLAEALRVGLDIPDTIMTSDQRQAESFVRQRPATIIKALGTEGVTVDDTLLLFFSARVTPDTKLEFANMNVGPVILQDAIEPAYDVRATVIGDKIFPAAITADAEKDLKVGVRDWRIGDHTGTLHINACDIPTGIEEKCIALVKNLGLKFGAIDMVVDKQGKHWFIENNPNGQWAFVEAQTKQPIGKAMAELLLSGSVER
ncbi:MAG: hypothetical protein ACREGD_00350 [Candidatus Saccharimonadales bacterium]